MALLRMQRQFQKRNVNNGESVNADRFAIIDRICLFLQMK